MIRKVQVMNNWLDLIVKDEVYKENIDVDGLKGQSLELEGPVPLDLVVWLLNQGVEPIVKTKGHAPTRNYMPVN